MAYKYSRKTRVYDREDVHQECYVAFISCVLSFNLEKFRGINLCRLAKLSVDRHCLRLWREDEIIRVPRCEPARQKETPAKKVSRFSEIERVCERRSRRINPADLIVDKRILSPHEVIERNEEIELLRMAIESLAGRQSHVINSRMCGVSFAEIGRENGITRQAAHDCYGNSLASIESRLYELGFYKSKSS